MFVAWQRKPLSARGTERHACPHPVEGLGRETIKPIVRVAFRLDGKPRNRVVARPGPAIRRCCIEASDLIARGRFWKSVNRHLSDSVIRLGGDLDAADPYELELHRERLGWLRAELGKVLPTLTPEESRLYALFEREAPFRNRAAAPSGTFAERLEAARRRFAAYMADPMRGFVERWWLDRDPPPAWWRPSDVDVSPLWFECLRRLHGEPRETFADEARAAAQGGPHALFEAAGALGLTWPCTEAELKAAWRRTAKTAHPDQGGTVEAFRRASTAYGELRQGLGLE